MSMTTDEAKALLKERGLRVTAPRVAVLRVLAAADAPLSHSEAVELLGDADWDPATIYRNLVKLRDAGLAPVVSRAGGIDRYALASSQHAGPHQHPHFVCDDCGKIACLPAELTSSMSVEGRWSASVRSAMVQLRGECPECLETHSHRG
ncbi:MAG: transcriptional repressor [Myxococcales bacterium]|nr:transcriptional repressor [Myxococcales bacterium]